MFLSLHSQQYLLYIYIYTLPVTKYFREDRYIHYLKSVHIWSFFRPYFAAFGLCILFEVVVVVVVVVGVGVGVGVGVVVVDTSKE